MWPFNRKKVATRPISGDKKLFSPNPEPDLPRSFGYKTAWWAFSSTDIYAVAEAIGLSNAQPCNWKTGIEASYGNGVFVCPSMDGWILVSGTGLPSGTDCHSSLLKLSPQFKDVQAYGTHRVVEYHSWARAINGELYRGFAYLGESGELLWDVGDDSTELQLGFNLPTANDLDLSTADNEDFDYPNEEHVMQISDKWSISPLDLDKRKILSAGLIGFTVSL